MNCHLKILKCRFCICKFKMTIHVFTLEHSVDSSSAENRIKLQSLQIPAIWLRHRPLRGVDSVRLQILLTGTCRECGSWFMSLATTTGRWLGETPFVQVGTTWALTCPETVHQRPIAWLTTQLSTLIFLNRLAKNSEFPSQCRRYGF